MQTERFTFTSAGGQRLAGRLDMPTGGSRGTALFAHCFSCGKDLLAAARIAAALNEAGIACMRFDFTGLGGSEGEFGTSGFSANLADLRAAAAYLGERGLGPQLLIGHSLGGTAVAAIAGELSTVRAVATIGAPADPAHALHQFGDALGRIEADGSAEVQLGPRSFRVSRTLVDDLRAHGAQPPMPRTPILVMHAPGDLVVGVDNARQLFEAARHPKSFVALDGADHLLTGPDDAAYAGRVIAAWASRYLPRGSAPEGTAAEGLVRVSETGHGRFQQRIEASGTSFLADEPVSVGGTGTGPSPYDLVAAGLGACTAMTLRLYADRKALPLDHVAVAISHRKVHAADCSDCEARDGRIDEFAREITLTGPLNPEDRARLREIADKCPVHRTLEGEVKVRTTLA
jgi:putative redox protein